MRFPSKETVERIRKEYPVGARVELVQMNDPQAPPVGTKGTVRGVDDRKRGFTNMFDVPMVQYIANEMHFYELVIFLEEHRSDYVHFILTGKPL